MVEIVRTDRKSPVLTPSAIPCLQQLPTINVTRGCSFGCVYCYIQGYPNYPGQNRIILYQNTAALVKEELARKRTKPARVYFSSSSDAFQNVPEVLDVSFETMRVLLEAGVGIALLTKGVVGERFIKLFARTPRLIFAQIGMTTLRADLSARVEPNAASPSQRLESIRSLARTGVSVTARLDPLIPDVTDTRDGLAPLLFELRRAGIRSAAASYLFVRPQFASKIQELEISTGACRDASAWPHQKFMGGRGGGRMVESAQRRDRFKFLQALGREAGIAIRACSCKNPDLTAVGCGIAGPPPRIQHAGKEQTLFSFFRSNATP